MSSEEATTSGSLIIVGAEGFDFGNHYWEVKINYQPNWEVGMLTEDTRNKLKEGKLDILLWEQCWSLKKYKRKYYPEEVDHQIKKYLAYQFQVFGIYLDMGKHTISFCDIKDLKVIIKLRVKTSKKLYPFFSPGLSVVYF